MVSNSHSPWGPLKIQESSLKLPLKARKLKIAYVKLKKASAGPRVISLSFGKATIFGKQCQ